MKKNEISLISIDSVYIKTSIEHVLLHSNQTGFKDVPPQLQHVLNGLIFLPFGKNRTCKFIALDLH